MTTSAVLSLLDPAARLVIGHRGAPAEAPENTLAAFRRAAELGVDGFELDVRVSADGVPVVIHDPTLDRTTDRSRSCARPMPARASRLTAAAPSRGADAEW